MCQARVAWLVDSSATCLHPLYEAASSSLTQILCLHSRARNSLAFLSHPLHSPHPPPVTPIICLRVPAFSPLYLSKYKSTAPPTSVHITQTNHWHSSRQWVIQAQEVLFAGQEVPSSFFVDTEWKINWQQRWETHFVDFRQKSKQWKGERSTRKTSWG